MKKAKLRNNKKNGKNNRLQKVIIGVIVIICLFGILIFKEVYASSTNTAPQFYGTTDITIRVGDSLDIKSGMYRIFAIDLEDGNITKNINIIQNNVNTNIIGEYEIDYEVQDKMEKKTTIKVPVHVVDSTNERKIQRTMYSLPSADHLSKSGFTIGISQDTQMLGVYLPAGEEIKIKCLNYSDINKEILAYCLNDDRLHEAAHSSAIYGLGSDYSNYSVVSEDKRVKINDDSSYIISNITATTMTSNSTGVSKKSEEFSDKSYDSVPFVDTLFDVAENPVLEITLNDNVKSIDYYTYGDSMSNFKQEWETDNNELAVIDGSRAQFIVPRIDLANLGVSKKYNNQGGVVEKYRHDDFNSIDDILAYYDDIVTQYDKYVGLEENADKPENKNVKTKLLIKADIHGAGGANYAYWKAINMTSDSLDVFLHKEGDGWLPLHEIGHGYQGNIKYSDLYLGEVSNNFYAYYYQKNNLENEEWLKRYVNNEDKLIQLVRNLDYSILNKYVRDDTNYSQTKNNDFASRLYAYAILFDKLEDSSTVPENILSNAYKKYRNLIYNGTSNNDILASELYIDSFSNSSNYNVIPYFEFWKVCPNIDIKKEIYDKDYPMVYPLKDLVTTEENLNRIKNDLDLKWDYSLVENEDIKSYGLKGNCNFVIEDINNIEQGSKLVLKSGNTEIQSVNIVENNISLVNIPIGIYEVEVKRNDGEITPRYIVISENKTTEYIIDTTPPSLDVTTDIIVSGENKQWTNENVELKIHVCDDGTGINEVKVNNNKIDIDEYGNATYIVKKNDTYQIVVTDKNGNRNLKEIVVENIDKVAPSIVIRQGVNSESKELYFIIYAANENYDLSGTDIIKVNDEVIEKKDKVSFWFIGYYTIPSSGKYIISATDKAGNTSTEEVTIDDIKVSDIKFDCTEYTITDQDQSIQLFPNIAPTSATNKELIWESSDENIATVDSTGKVTPVSNGTCSITATTKDGSEKTAMCNIIVNLPIKVTSITLNKTSYTFTNNTPLQLTATVLPENATNKEVTWESTNPSNVVVDQSGKVTVTSNSGSGMIIARAKDGSGKTAICNITIDIPTTNISLDKSECTLFGKGDSITLNATIQPSSMSQEVIWTSSNTNVATVDSTGKVTSVGIGNCVITATSTQSSSLKASCEITVEEVKVTSITLNKTSHTFTDRTPLQLVATVLPENATNKEITWETTSPNNLAVDSTGKVIPTTNQGGGMIIARAKDGSGKTAICNITIDIPTTNISLDKSECTLFGKGDSITLNATIQPSSMSQEVTWTSSNTNVATVDSTGKVTSVGIGNCVITATSTQSSSLKASCEITVEEVKVTSITLNKTSYTFTNNTPLQLTVTVEPENATNKEVTWESTNPSTLVVDQNGKVIPTTNSGGGMIIARAKDGSGKTAICNITIDIPTTNISLDKSECTLFGKGDSITLNATIQPSSMSQEVTWISSNTSVATVDNSGKVTSVGVGTCVITATSKEDSSLKASCNVTVEEVKVTSITLNKTSHTFTDRTPLQLVATVLPENATNKEITWETTSPNNLAVDSTGKVIPTTNQGGGMIIARAKDGSGKVATCNITIDIGGSATYKKGDINKDGKVNIKDWNKMYEYIKETIELNAEELELGDINGDGKVNIKDWNRLYDHITEVNPLY